MDDEENLVRLLRGYLEREGFEVHEALDGRSALDAARRLDPELIVLDWTLPGLDGMDVLRELRRYSGAYVILARKFGEPAGDKTVIGLRVTHYDLAAMVASTRESVTAAVGALRRQGILEKSAGTVTILEPRALAKISYAS